MKKIVNLAAFLTLASLVVAVATWAEDGSSGKTTRPPRNLKKVGDHWTPWDPPTAGQNDYIIQKGDTLWNLGQQWLGNPFLWPQIWDQNRYIQDSHWIYPGDPIAKPGTPTVVPPGGPPPGEASGEEETRMPDASPSTARRIVPTTLERKALQPLAQAHDVYCSGFIDPDHAQSRAWIVGREMERMGVATGDVIYLNQGRGQGIESGMDLAVLRKAWQVVHPATGRAMGDMVKRLGRVRVLCAQENAATGVIMDSCDAIYDTDELVPWAEIPVPRVTNEPPFDRYCGASTEPRGYVVAIKDNLTAAGNGHIIHTDLGEGSGVRPGEFLSVYRDNDELPRKMIGQALILTVEPGSSTAKVTMAVRDVGMGDRVEVVR